MPIEPASVSKPVVREIEQSSIGASPWNFAQGSSTGGKDRQISSIWEKAISGAQRLFGSEKPAEQAVEEDGEKEDGSPRGEQPQSNLTALNSLPGSGGRGFGRYRLPVGAGNALMSAVGSMRINESPEPRAAAEAWQAKDEGRPVASTGCVGDLDHEAEQTEKARRSDANSSEELNEKQNKSKAKSSAPSAPTPVASRPLPTLSSTEVASTPIAAQTEAAAVLSAGEAAARTAGPHAAQAVQVARAMDSAGDAQPKPVATTQPSQPSAQPHSAPVVTASEALAPASPVTNSRQVTQTQSKPEAVAEKVPLTTSNPVADSSVGTASIGNSAVERASASAREPAASKPVLPDASLSAKESPASSVDAKSLPAPQQAVSKAAANAGVETESSTLSFDSQKAKDSVSETLTRQIRPTTQTAASVTPAAPTSAAAQSLSGESATPRPALAESAAPVSVRSEGLSGDAKEALLTDASRKDVAVSQAARTAAARSSEAGQLVRQGATAEQSHSMLENANAAAGAAKTASQFAVSATSHSSSNAAAAAVSRPAVPVVGLNGQPTTPSANAALAGVSAGQPTAGVGVNSPPQQSGSHTGAEGGAAKQDFGSTLQNASSSAKGAEKGADAQQSFEVKTAEGESTRRAEVVSKTRQSSYVTKTAEEMKEVVAAMSKSVESLATSKGGAMTLKLNFEQGGSMTLRVSMEGGQVSTMMQTDVSGLEAVIKSHWTELANDWNQKGIKLNVPQFQQGASAHGDGDARADQWTDLSQRQERGAQSFFGSSGRQNGGRESAAARQGSAPAGTPLDANAGQTADAPESGPIGSAPEREWKAYA